MDAAERAVRQHGDHIARSRASRRARDDRVDVVESVEHRCRAVCKSAASACHVEALIRRQVARDARQQHRVGGTQSSRDTRPGENSGRRWRCAVRTRPTAAPSDAALRSASSVSRTAVGWCAKSSYTNTPPGACRSDPGGARRRADRRARAAGSRVRRRSPGRSAASAAATLARLWRPMSGVTQRPAATPPRNRSKLVPVASAALGATSQCGAMPNVSWPSSAYQ